MFKRWILGLVTFVIASVLILSTMAMAPAASLATTPGCTSYVRHISGDSDSAVWGGYWAMDTFTSTYTVCPTGPKTSTVTRHDKGTFASWGSESPNASGFVGINIGDIDGTWAYTVNGTVVAPTTDLGSVDYMCDHNGNCSSAPSSLDKIFASGYTVDYNDPDNWDWVYTTCNSQTQTWTNSANANTGDITGSGGHSCVPVVAPAHIPDTCVVAWKQLFGPYDQQVVHPETALRIYNSHKCGSGDGGWVDQKMSAMMEKQPRQHFTGDGK